MSESSHPARTAKAVRVLLANKQALVRAGVRALLDDQADIEVAAEANGPEEALELLANETVDVAVVETDRQSGALLERLANVPNVRLLAMTASSVPTEMLDALRAGASGVIPQTASAQVLPEAVRALSKGLRWMTPDLEQYCRQNVTTLAEATAVPAKERSEDWERLTPREREIAELVGEGLRHADIAERLGISIHTVKNHLRHVFVKLDVTGRVELAVYVRS